MSSDFISSDFCHVSCCVVFSDFLVEMFFFWGGRDFFFRCFFRIDVFSISFGGEMSLERFFGRDF